MWGILPVDKPEGQTSHDVVDRVRNTFATRRVGHAGTLDPLATGVLVVCIGRATRLTQYITGRSKRYQAWVRLGTRMDTLDAEGTPIEQSDQLPSSIEPILEALEHFKGTIWQTPPMFSAKKVGGKRLHRLARKGLIVKREPVQVTIEDLRIGRFDGDRLEFDVTCSKGTYVRVLADDLGVRLGCGAHITALRRVASGSITIDQCSSLEAIESGEGEMLDPNEALSDLEEAVVLPEAADRFVHGGRVDASVEVEQDAVLRVTDASGRFLGVGRVLEDAIQPECVLAVEEAVATG